MFKIEMSEEYSRSWVGWLVQFNQGIAEGRELYRQVFAKTHGSGVSFELPVPTNEVGTYRFLVEAAREVSHPSATTRDIPFSMKETPIQKGKTRNSRSGP
jgi:hypothetical protein